MPRLPPARAGGQPAPAAATRRREEVHQRAGLPAFRSAPPLRLGRQRLGRAGGIAVDVVQRDPLGVLDRDRAPQPERIRRADRTGPRHAIDVQVIVANQRRAHLRVRLDQHRADQRGARFFEEGGNRVSRSLHHGISAHAPGCE